LREDETIRKGDQDMEKRKGMFRNQVSRASKSDGAFAFVNPWHAAMADFIGDMEAADRRRRQAMRKTSRARAERPTMRA
jgi:hypothetical protein